MPNPTERILELEGNLQSLRLELAEQKRTTEKLKLELERQRGGESARLAAAQVEKLLSDVATPISQLLTQTHLLKVEGRPVQASDVLAIAARLVRALEDHGLTIEGAIGQSVAFDPNHHEPLSIEEELQPGQEVVIRMVGLAYRGKLLRRAGVVMVAGE
jgi:molecular chaperone GrpE (heat shock protein)